MNFRHLEESYHARLFFFFSVYLFQGLPGGYALTALALYYTEKGVTPEALGTFATIIGVPWAFKFLWGPFLDSIPNWRLGRRRVPIFLLFVGCCGALWLLVLIEEPVSQIGLVGKVFCLHALFASVLDVVVDALAIEVLPEEERGRASAAMMVGRFAGNAFGSAALAWVLAHLGYLQSIFLLAGLSSVLCLSPLFFLESTRRSEKVSNPMAVLRKTLQALAKRESLKIAMVVASVDVTISLARRLMEYAFIHDHGWTAENLSILKGVGGATLALVVVTGIGFLSDRIGPKKTTAGTIAVFILTYSTMLLLFSEWGSQVVGVGYNFMDLALRPAFQCAMMPLLMDICEPDVEGSQYATYSGLFNLADITGAHLFGKLTAPLGVFWVLALCVASLAATLFAFLRK